MFSSFGKGIFGFFIFMWLLGNPDILGAVFFIGIGLFLLKSISKDVWEIFRSKSKEKVKSAFKTKKTALNKQETSRKKPYLVLENCSPLTKYLLDEFDKDDRELLLRYFKRECPGAWHLTIVSLDKRHKNIIKNLSV